jgi:hypothetical protein
VTLIAWVFAYRIVRITIVKGCPGIAKDIVFATDRIRVLNHRGGGAREAFEILASFKNRNDAALGVFFGNLHQPRRRPGEILFNETKTAQRISA